MTGKVILVGAGCGDFDLITLRGKDVLMRCDTVIYDSLTDTRLLDFCPNAEKICAGKRAGSHSVPQEEINSLLVEKALLGKNVVRLKGGDPFVFGRGGEEILTLQEHNIPYAIVPGISSCIAIPELSGIPVTHRLVSRSFHVITAHTAEGISAERFSQYAKLDGTLVFLMGLHALEEISQGLISAGMSGNTPSAVISNGASFSQRVVKAPLCEIAKKVRKENLAPPAVIVVGETVSFDFTQTYIPPLYGTNAVVISSAHTAQKLVCKLNSLGAYAYRVGGIELKELHNEKIDRALNGLDGYTHIALTSPNGARIFLKKLRDKHIDLRKLVGVKLAVIGKGTAAVLEESGIYPEIMPNEYNTSALAGLLCEKLSYKDRLLIMRSSEGSREFTEILDKEGNIKYDDISIYKPIYNSAERIENGFALFTSAGAVKGFFENGGSLSDNATAAAIGKVTARELEKHGVKKPLVPKESTVDSMVKVLTEINQLYHTSKGDYT